MPKSLERESLGNRAVKAGVWSTAMQVVGKSMGLVRNLALARLLAPDDFGLFGITVVVLSLITRFSNVGLQQALIQKTGDIGGYLDTAWTFSLARAGLWMVGLGIAAPWIAGFFEEPAATPLIRVLGLALFVRALWSPGLVLFRRELELRRRYIHRTIGIVSDLVISVSLAFVLHSAWALMWGYLGSNLIQLFVSYVIAPYQPTLMLHRAKLMELGRYARWVFLNQVLFFLAYRGDNLLVGKFFGATGLGIYMMAYMITEVAVTEIGSVSVEVAFPAFSRAQGDKDRLRRGFLTNLEWVFDTAFPISIVMILCAAPLALLVLGERWVQVATVLPFLALAASGRALVMQGNALLNGLGRPDLTLRMNLVIVGITYGLYFPMISWLGLRGVAAAVMLGQLGTLPLYALFIQRVAGIRVAESARRLVPGLLLGSGVGAVILLARTDAELWNFVATLVAAALAYVAGALILWRARQIGPVMILQRLRTAYGK
jgi:O-antigen/teichoic acid export membrane protein